MHGCWQARVSSRMVSVLPSAWTRRVAMKSIDEHIKKDQTDLEAAKAEGNDAKVRHISEELESLQDYKKELSANSATPQLEQLLRSVILTPMSAASTTTEPSTKAALDQSCGAEAPLFEWLRPSPALHRIRRDYR